MNPRQGLAIASLCAAILFTATACGADEDPELLADVPVAPAATASPSVTPLPTPTSTATPDPTPSPLPTPTPQPRRLCQEDPEAYAQRLEVLAESVSAALEGYPGTFGFALYDLDCETLVSVNPEYVQYTASTGKLPFLIAALRAVQEGTLEYTAIEADVISVLHVSSDEAANRIVAKVSREQVEEVLSIAGVSELTRFRDSWSNYNSTAADFTRIWVALMRGELLDAEFTELVLRLTSEAEVDVAFETFYSHFDRPDLQFGQKVGHAVIFAPPYYLVGSGYIRPFDGSSEGVAATLVLKAANLDERRKDVLPLILDFVEEAAAELDG